MMAKDEFGPNYVVEVHNPSLGIEGFLVIDNTALGPGKGGIRMTADVTVEEIRRLARAMTWKNALAGIPFGGAKSGLVWNPPQGSSADIRARKKETVEWFARSLAPFIPKYYIAGPDVNTGAEEMRWFAEASGKWNAATGKPSDFCTKSPSGKKKCGLPHELGSTGFGVAHATAVAANLRGIDLKKATVAIEGYGNVGSFAHQFLQEMGAKIVAVADRGGGVYHEEGLDVKSLRFLKSQGRSVYEYPHGKKLSHDDLLILGVDILIPASVTDVIKEGHKNKIQAKIIVEGANIPMRENVEESLWKRGIVVVPDIIANAGGVISSYAEYRGFYASKMLALVERTIKKTVREVMEKSLKERRNPREVAFQIARERIMRASTS